MKKKVLLCLLLLISVFTLAGCGSSENKDNNESGVERESKKNQIGFKEGKYSIKNLTFDLPDGYKSNGDNSYMYTDDNNAIVVNVYVKENFEGTLDDIINKDYFKMFPNSKSLTDTVINGNNWLKGNSTDGATLYYIKDGNDFYGVSLEPLFTTKAMVNTLIETVEGSLYFK